MSRSPGVACRHPATGSVSALGMPFPVAAIAQIRITLGTEVTLLKAFLSEQVNRVVASG
jgi:hypothetical protein